MLSWSVSTARQATVEQAGAEVRILTRLNLDVDLGTVGQTDSNVEANGFFGAGVGVDVLAEKRGVNDFAALQRLGKVEHGFNHRTQDGRSPTQEQLEDQIVLGVEEFHVRG